MKLYICFVLILGLATVISAKGALKSQNFLGKKGYDDGYNNLNFDSDLILNKNKQILVNEDWSKDHTKSFSDEFSKSDDKNSQSISISINFSGGCCEGKDICFSKDNCHDEKDRKYYDEEEKWGGKRDWEGKEIGRAHV